MLSSCEKSKLINLIKELGKEAETIKKSSIEYSYKDDNSPLSAADTLVNNELNQFVKQTDFKNIISEENEFISYDERKKWEYFWLIDPIDGTKEYIKKGNDYTINIALCIDNAPIFSVVYAPARLELFSAEIGHGSYLNNKKLKIKRTNNKCLKVVASKSHLNSDTIKFIDSLRNAYDIEVLQFGSSLKICKIAEGEADLYPRFGPTMEWDVCASDLILREAGGIILNLDNNEMKYNKENLLNPFFIATKDKKYTR